MQLVCNSEYKIRRGFRLPIIDCFEAAVPFKGHGSPVSDRDSAQMLVSHLMDELQRGSALFAVDSEECSIQSLLFFFDPLSV